MITREDLKKISTESFIDGQIREVVEYDNKFYVVGSVTCPVNQDDEEAFFGWLDKLPADMSMMILFGMIPLNETYVMEAKLDEETLDYVPLNECGEHCATGVCNKRLASNTTIGNQDLAYSMLIAHLNA